MPPVPRADISNKSLFFAFAIAASPVLLVSGGAVIQRYFYPETLRQSPEERERLAEAKRTELFQVLPADKVLTFTQTYELDGTSGVVNRFNRTAGELAYCSHYEGWRRGVTLGGQNGKGFRQFAVECPKLAR